MLEALAASSESALDATLLPLASGLSHFPQCRVDAEDELRLRHGQGISAELPKGFCVVFAEDSDRAIALADSDGNGRVKPSRGFSAAS